MQNGVDTHEDKIFELPVQNKNDITAEDSTNKTAGKRSRMKRDMLLNGETTNPVEVTFEDVSAAAFRIKSGIRRTPCDKSERLSAMLGMEVYCKKDYMQATGSFKERGARNTLLMLPKDQKNRGVIAASAGNHALALAYHGKKLNIPVQVCMPINAPITKVSQCRKYGAVIHMIGDDIIEARDYGLNIAAKEGLAYINGYDHPDILAGQGSCGLEIAEQVDDIDAVVIPVGGGGLIAGCAVALKALHPNIEIIGVESEKCASFAAAMKAGQPVKISSDQSLTLADGLCVSKVGSNAFATAKDNIDRLIQVSESYIAMAVLRLVEEEKCVVEGAGATGLAAAFAGLLPELKGKRVVFPLCGGNIDSTVLGRVIERGLAADGRLVRFSAVVSDRPGGLSELTKMLSDLRVSVKDIFHERAWLKTSVFSVVNKVVCECRDYEHAQELKKALEDRYDEVSFSTNAVQES
ncbi:L-threonine ammonia-lyase-like isoform X1 [Hydractinia symbiolongicarpus]|uniref:L-threonine ammonia-lyase-like isoform X1 n=1 Tax=Hydractinia symbiolongicarpus TaxID=13093 RepID=UPI00254ACCDA|nr:L-threonine ammonia-lyase-like isoform X1 [Hydractinia symbiolongicarpus]